MAKKQIDYSIIIPFHSNEFFLRICVESLEKTLPSGTEIILVTSSAAPDFDWMKKKQIHLIRSSSQLTYPQSINLGVKEAKGQFVIFCDSDTSVSLDWFEQLTALYHSNNLIGIASSKLINPYSNRIMDFGIGYTQYNSPHIGHDRLSNFPLYKDSRKVQSACSANMIISKRFFNDLNGFDEALGYSYCDLDLCLRAKELGKETWVVGDSIVYHRGNSSDSNLNIYKNDVKGRFWAINGHRVTMDMSKYFVESLAFFNRSNIQTSNSFLLVDLSTVTDREWHYHIFRDKLNLKVADICKIASTTRDTQHIALYDSLNWNILKLRFPILYFVDRFISVKNNALWWQLRNRDTDIVIDRNGNIESIKNAVKDNT